MNEGARGWWGHGTRASAGGALLAALASCGGGAGDLREGASPSGPSETGHGEVRSEEASTKKDEAPEGPSAGDDCISKLEALISAYETHSAPTDEQALTARSHLEELVETECPWLNRKSDDPRLERLLPRVRPLVARSDAARARKESIEALADARATLRALAERASEVYARTGKLCASATSPVPPKAEAVSGTKYQSSASDWAGGDRDAGFACLGFRRETPQAFQYDYAATRAGFKITARGDRNGDGVFEVLVVEGVVEGKGVSILDMREVRAGE